MLTSDVVPLSTKTQHSKLRNAWYICNKRKAIRTVFLRATFSTCDTFHYHVSQLQNQPPLASHVQPFVLGLFKPSSMRKLWHPLVGITYLQTSLFSLTFVFFFHLSHASFNLLNCPILLQHPSSPFLKQNFLLSSTDVNLTSHPAHLTPALDKIVK